jgi:ABC-type branched-subunit amino acid transport system permease subunit
MSHARWSGPLLALVAIVLLLLAPLALERSPYLMHLAITGFFYAILAASWSLLAGYAGQFSFGHMAFMAIGAYTSALFGTYVRFTSVPTNLCREFPLGDMWLVLLDPIGIVQSGSPNCLEIARATFAAGTVIIRPSLWLGIGLGVLVGGLFGLLIGGMVLRLRSTYLALFTIGFSEILRSVLSAEINITQGQSGLEMLPLFPRGLTIGTVFFSSALLHHALPLFALHGNHGLAHGLAFWALYPLDSGRRRGRRGARRTRCTLQSARFRHHCDDGGGRGRGAGALHRHHYTQYLNYFADEPGHCDGRNRRAGKYCGRRDWGCDHRVCARIVTQQL